MAKAGSVNWCWDTAVSERINLTSEEALRLSRTERGGLHGRQAVSLNSDLEQEAEWEKLEDERERSLLEGTAKLIPLDKALA